MELKESFEKTIEAEKLDALFKAIGWKPRGESKWKEVLSKSSFVYSLYDGNDLIGFGRILEDSIMCMFYDIGVHPNYERRGIGTRIMQKLIDKVKYKGYASIGLFAWDKNPKNIQFYEKFGYKLTKGMELIKYMKPE